MFADTVLPTARQDGDPQFSVHTLGEFLYCPRAGLQSFENQGDGDEPIDRADATMKLNFLPPYDLAKLRAQRDWSFQYVLWMLASVLLSGLVAMLLATFFSATYTLAFLVPGLVGGKLLIDESRKLRFLHRHLRVAEKAARWSPPDNLNIDVDINWWSMLNDNFDSVRYDDMLTDDRTGLGGKPWRVMRRGALRIPVIHLKREKAELSPGHYAKAAAYCHLLSVNEPGTVSPYGIILFGDTYRGVAVPNNQKAQSSFHRALERGRAVVRKSRLPGGDPHRPSEERSWICNSCHWGEPFVVRPGMNDTLRFGQYVPLFVSLEKNDRSYHSHCGDRFRWMPEHEKIHEQQLTEIDQYYL